MIPTGTLSTELTRSKPRASRDDPEDGNVIGCDGL